MVRTWGGSWGRESWDFPWGLKLVRMTVRIPESGLVEVRWVD